ncbi:hypothetical protein QUF58_06490 [Anaerolineales bacterium HSG24]|nr:hypothetical protein [Anaerolineales bacterium HSG24]
MWHLPIAVNRNKEHILFQQMLTGQKSHRILSLCAEGGQGKSWLLDSFSHHCRQSNTPRGLVRFASDQPTDPLDCMRNLAEHLGETHFAEFHQLDYELHHPQAVINIAAHSVETAVSIEATVTEQSSIKQVAGGSIISTGDITVNPNQSPEHRAYVLRRLTKVFKQALTTLAESSPVVLLFDAFEHVPSTTADWVQKELLSLIRSATVPNLVVVLAGRPKAHPSNLSNPHEWQGWLKELKRLSPFTSEEVQLYFIERCQLHHLDPETVYKAYYEPCKNNPMLMGQLAESWQVNEWNDL